MTHAPWPQVAVAHKSDPGREPSKQVNEDACFYQETHLGHLLVVCDGMGGHAAGREASNLAIHTIFSEIGRLPHGSPPGESLRQAVKTANRRVWAMGGPSDAPGRPGSTCVAVLVHPGGVEVAHVGDSRVYLVRAGQIWQLTRDHSMVQQMVDAGMLRPEDAVGHPDSNKITRALGMEQEADVELRRDVLLQQRGDLILLCSDGVTDVVRDSDLLTVATLSLDVGRLPQLCEQVVQLANARGGPDNITIMAGLVVEPGLAPWAGQTTKTEPGNTLPEPADTEPAPPVFGGELPPATTRMPKGQGTLPGGEPAPLPPPPAQPAPPQALPPQAPPPQAMPPVASAPQLSATGQALSSPAPSAPAASGQVPSPSDSLGRKRPGAGATVPLAVHGGPQPTSGSTGSRQPTIIDDQTIDGQAPSAPSRPAPSRGGRIAMGVVLFVVGAVLAGLSLRGLVYQDEAPPPLTETSASASASR